MPDAPRPPCLLVLGAGPAHVPVIRRAKARGLRTVVVGGAPGEPGMEIADECRIIDLREVEGVLHAAREISPDGVLTVSTDVSFWGTWPCRARVPLRWQFARTSWP